MREAKLFCQYNPLFYWISVQKERLLRHLLNLFAKKKFASARMEEPLPYIVKSHTSLILRPLPGVDMALQEGKAVNLRLASAKIHGLIIRPGETFSFWRLVGKCTTRKGYKEGLVLRGSLVDRGVGGGMCQLANMIHYLVLNSPLTVTELHHHTDALFPDSQRRVPFGTGTSIFYNYVDYQFRNDTEDAYQLLLWQAEGDLCGELRSSRKPEYRYRLVERHHYFAKEGDRYFRHSQVFRQVLSPQGLIREELVLTNHSQVLYDPALIPPDQLRGEPIHA